MTISRVNYEKTISLKRKFVLCLIRLLNILQCDLLPNVKINSDTNLLKNDKNSREKICSEIAVGKASIATLLKQKRERPGIKNFLN